MGGNNGGGSGQGIAVVWKIKGTGDAEVIATDNSGNQSIVSCLVPPPTEVGLGSSGFN